MSAIPVTTDILPSNVPKLDVKGINWAIFAFRFQVAVEAKELWGHMDGTATRPTYSAPLSVAQRIPDSTALRIQKKASVETDLRTQFLESKLAKGADVRQFLDGRSTIIKSLPNPLANFASSQLTAARLFTTAKTLEPDVLISKCWECGSIPIRRMLRKATVTQRMAYLES